MPLMVYRTVFLLLLPQHAFNGTHTHIYKTKLFFVLPHQFHSDAINNVRVVESPAVVLEGCTHIEARLVIPEGQEVVQFVVGHGLGGRRHGVPGGGVGGDGLRTWRSE